MQKDLNEIKIEISNRLNEYCFYLILNHVEIALVAFFPFSTFFITNLSLLVLLRG